MQMVLVSACLLGAQVRYHGGDALVASAVLQRWRDEGRIVALCPEVAGGLPTPRPPAEIRRGAGAIPLAVVTADGRDVSEPYVRGAREAVDTAVTLGIRAAVLKDGSPSCGSSFVHDGTFTGTRAGGEGLTTARLRAAGVRVFSETQIAEAAEWLGERET